MFNAYVSGRRVMWMLSVVVMMLVVTMVAVMMPGMTARTVLSARMARVAGMGTRVAGMRWDMMHGWMGNAWVAARGCAGAWWGIGTRVWGADLVVWGRDCVESRT